MNFDEELTEIIIPEDKDTLCRFCLNISDSIVKINDSKEIRWPEHGNLSSSQVELLIKLDESDNLPAGICTTCQETMDNFTTFLEKLRMNQEILKSCFLDEDFKSLERITVSTKSSEVIQDEIIVKIEEDVPKTIYDHNYSTKNAVNVNCDQNLESGNGYNSKNNLKYSMKELGKHANLKKIASQSQNEPDEIIIKRCFFCVEKFANNDLYILHYLNHVIQETEETVTHRPHCRYCGLLIAFKEEIEEHIVAEHQNHDTLFCHECNIQFSRNEEVVQHIERDHIENYEEELLNESIKCPICENEFDEVGLLIEHSLTHISRRYTCMKCKKIFICDAARNEHHREHPQYKYKCPICKKLASGRSNLEAHIATHSTTRDFECDQCGRAYKTKNHLIYHKSVHSRPKSICSVCGYSTHLSKDFTTHLRTHSNERPFVCTFEDCGRAYKTNSALSSHVKSHLNIKEFSCDSCDYKTSRSVGLSIHKRIHTGERPYYCHVCPKTFNRKWNLTLHLRKLHPSSQ